MAEVKRQPDEEYRAAPGVSYSFLKDFATRPDVAYGKYLKNDAPPYSSPQMDFGRLFHEAMCNPDWRKHAAIYPKELLSVNGAATTNAAREFARRAAENGQLVCKESEIAALEAMVQSVRVATEDLISRPGGLHEAAFYWTDPETRLVCKSRPDLFWSGGTILDFKTTQSLESFPSSIEKYRYWIQDVHYTEGFFQVYGHLPTFVFVAVESSWPYGAALFRLSDDDRVRAAMSRQSLMAGVRRCFDTGDWSSPYGTTIHEVRLRESCYVGIPEEVATEEATATDGLVLHQAPILEADSTSREAS